MLGVGNLFTGTRFRRGILRVAGQQQHHWPEHTVYWEMRDSHQPPPELGSDRVPPRSADLKLAGDAAQWPLVECKDWRHTYLSGLCHPCVAVCPLQRGSQATSTLVLLDFSSRWANTQRR